jgi:hypothetical protein
VSTICAGVSISYHDISLFVHVCAMFDIPCRTRVARMYGDVGTSSYIFLAERLLSSLYYKNGTIRCLGLYFLDGTVRLIEIF